MVVVMAVYKMGGCTLYRMNLCDNIHGIRAGCRLAKQEPGGVILSSHFWSTLYIKDGSCCLFPQSQVLYRSYIIHVSIYIHISMSRDQGNLQLMMITVVWLH